MGLNGVMLEKVPAVCAAITILIPYCTDVDTCARALNVQTSWSEEDENAHCVEHPLLSYPDDLKSLGGKFPLSFCGAVGRWGVVAKLLSSFTRFLVAQALNQKKTMTSSAENKTCRLCWGSVAEGRDQAIFTAECSHTFHFSCICSYISQGHRICPVCTAQWNYLPIIPPRNTFTFPVPNFRPQPLSFSFCDDEPLPLVTAGGDPMSIDSLVDLHKVTIKSVPECRAVGPSESVSQFAVLIGLKAPSLSSQRVPIDIVTVLDVSGSMKGMKLSLVKRAVHFVIDNLGVSDRLSIVCFSNGANRVLPLRRMTEGGREDAKRAVDLLVASGGTNIAEGLKMGVRVLEERHFKNPVTSIIFLSDGVDTYNLGRLLQGGDLHLLPPSIFPRNQGSGAEPEEGTIPVHSFGFGADHDPITMHAIADASGGTFSFIESYEMVQDAFAGCIGGLLSVVTQELRLKLRSASHGVEIKSIPSGRYKSEISNQGSEGLINVGDLYADEEKEFLINVSIPVFTSNEGEDSQRKTSLLDITCSYKDAVSKQTVVIEGDLVEVRRPTAPTPQDLAMNLEVDRQKNRVRAAESIKQAQQMAEAGNLFGAMNLLQQKRSYLMSTASAQAGDGMTKWLEGEMKETEMRMGSATIYQQSGRAYALSGMSSHASQRATTRGGLVAGGAQLSYGSTAFGAPIGGAQHSFASTAFGGYATPQMSDMVLKSQQQSKAGEGSASK
ncbi:E3 ubiquitin-protein ligase WAV3-like [Salvia miltiorrhiza]|uniref:E3 ubiquitin-protein ligase WAV3-like n=1 Tax=Salvia miltiorrhiza TaxID=226208 RepID=UPI0025AB85F6|nr:E3 ubiquitin-protein ligase WAV3-like [Salvia miltiorrhiza]